MPDSSRRYVVSSLAIAALLILPALTWAAEPTTAPTGYGYLLLRMTLMLAIVCALAIITLRWGLKRFLPSSSSPDSLQVVARLPLEPRRSLLVVRVATRHLLIATSEAGITSLGDLSPHDAQHLTQNISQKKKKLFPQTPDNN